MATYVVSSTAELTQALAAAQGGDRVELTSGDYGDLFLRDLDFTSTVVITAHDNTPPVFSSIKVNASSHITFDGIDVDFEPAMETKEFFAAFRSDGSSHISVVNSTITGGPSIGGVPEDTPAGEQTSAGILGRPMGMGLGFYHSDNITLENNTISEFSAGVRFYKTDGIDILQNEIHNVRMVPVSGGEVDNMTVEGNYFHTMVPWKFGGLGDHGDHVHIWTMPNQTEPSENFVFRDNYFAEGDGVSVLGIYMDDNNNDMGFTNVVVENNVLHNGDSQGLRMEDVVGLTVRNNTFLQSSGDAQDAPGIFLADGNKDVVIEQNIYSKVYGPGLEDAEANNIVIQDNFEVQSLEPGGENYAGNLFVNAKTGSPTLADLQVLPDGDAAAFGARLGEQPDRFVTDQRGDGLDLNTHTFALTTDTPGEVTWDFGDGTQGTGQTVTHTYESVGTYTAVATVLAADGTSFQVNKVVDVISPAALHETFDDHASATDSMLRIDDENPSVSFDSSNGMTGNDAFTISVAFKKDAGTEDLGGRILNFSGTAVVILRPDGIDLRGLTDAGESIVLRSDDVSLSDTDWHQVTYTFSQSTGKATLYLDGEEVAQIDGLTGSQYTVPGHNLHLGNPFSTGFEGYLDNAVFLRDALTPEQVAQEYENYVAGNPVFDFLSEAPEDIHFAPLDDINTVDAALPEAAPVTAPEAVEIPASLALDTEAPLPSEISSVTLGAPGVTASMEREHADDILGQDSFAISMNLTASSPESVGEVVRLHQSFVINVTDDGELYLRVFTEDGSRIRLTTDGADLTDMAAHDITITRADNMLNIDVDGAILASAEMTSPLANKGQHDLAFGNPWGKENFEGEVADFKIAVTPDAAPSTPVVDPATADALYEAIAEDTVSADALAADATYTPHALADAQMWADQGLISEAVLDRFEAILANYQENYFE